MLKGQKQSSNIRTVTNTPCLLIKIKIGIVRDLVLLGVDLSEYTWTISGFLRLKTLVILTFP